MATMSSVSPVSQLLPVLLFLPVLPVDIGVALPSLFPLLCSFPGLRSFPGLLRPAAGTSGEPEWTPGAAARPIHE
ncbi:hypothetical protein OG216_18385 [Streptomycetaceae bacterium NBC_01309]